MKHFLHLFVVLCQASIFYYYSDATMFTMIDSGFDSSLLAPPAERQRSFFNADSSVVRPPSSSSSTFHLKY